MRIGIFTELYEPYISGVVTSIKVLVDTLRAMNHEVYIVTANLKNKKFIYDEKNKIIYMPGINTGICGTKLTSVYSQKAMKIIKSWHLDVIHSQTEFGIGMFSRIVAKKLDIPVVHTYHTMYEDYVYYVTHGYFDKAARKLAIKITKYFCEKKCDELIVPTAKIERLFKEKYQIKKQIHVIPTGIDTTKFKLTPAIKKEVAKLKVKYHLTSEDFVIGSISRIAQEKSLDRLLKSMQKIAQYNPHIKLMIVGDGPYLKELKQLTKDLEIEKKVIFTGIIEYQKIHLYYHLFNVFTSFSVTETQGLTIIEALASGLPAIVINDKSFTDVVQDKYNGYLFTDENAYSEIILKLVNDKKTYQSLEQNAQNSVYRYSKEVFASDVLKVYAQAVEKRKERKE